MNAEEARRLTEAAKGSKQAKSNGTLEILVDHATAEIRRAAARRESFVDDPVDGLRLAYSREERDCAYAILKLKGFRVVAAPAGGTGRVRVEW